MGIRDLLEGVRDMPAVEESHQAHEEAPRIGKGEVPLPAGRRVLPGQTEKVGVRPIVVGIPILVVMVNDLHRFAPVERGLMELRVELGQLRLREEPMSVKVVDVLCPDAQGTRRAHLLPAATDAEGDLQDGRADGNRQEQGAAQDQADARAFGRAEESPQHADGDDPQGDGRGDPGPTEPFACFLRRRRHAAPFPRPMIEDLAEVRRKARVK